MAIYEVNDCYGIRTDPDGICPYEGFMPSNCPKSCSVCKYLHGPTNADRIRAMTDEELAELLTAYKCVDCILFSRDCKVEETMGSGKTCEERILDWLREEGKQ